MPRAETRHEELPPYADGEVPNGWTVVWTNPEPAIATGTGEGFRNGEWITLLYIRIDIRVVFKGNLQRVRLALIQLNDASVAATPTIGIDDSFKSDPFHDTGRYRKILMDMTIYPTGGAILPDTPSTSQGIVVHRKFRKRLHIPIHYTGDAATTIDRNGLRLFQFGDNAGTVDTCDLKVDGQYTFVNQA